MAGNDFEASPVMRGLRTRKKPGKRWGGLEVDPERLRELARGMYSQASLAALLNISHDTLSRRLQEPEYREAFERGRSEGCAEISNLQMKAARKGNPAMLIWLGKQHLGQRDTNVTQLAGPEGGSMQIEIIRVAVQRDMEAPAPEAPQIVRLNGKSE